MLGADIAVIGVSAACTLVNMHLCPARAIDKAGTHIVSLAACVAEAYMGAVYE